jgi:hypothetical protein
MSALATFPLADEDIPPDIEPNDDAPLRCQFDGCSNEVVKPARGRTPKFCPEHRRQASTPTGKRSANWGRANEIENILNKYALGLSFGITLVNPVDGRIVAQGTPAVVHEIVELGRVDKQWRKYLEMIATPGKYGPLVMASLTIVIPVMANHKLLPVMLSDVVTAMGEGG